MIRRPPRSTQSRSSAASDVYKRQVLGPRRVDLHQGGLLGGVVLADLLDHPAIALGARVGHDDAVVGRPDLAEALETDLDGHSGGLSWFCWGGSCEPTRGARSSREPRDTASCG